MGTGRSPLASERSATEALTAEVVARDVAVIRPAERRLQACLPACSLTRFGGSESTRH